MSLSEPRWASSKMLDGIFRKRHVRRFRPQFSLEFLPQHFVLPEGHLAAAQLLLKSAAEALSFVCWSLEHLRAMSVPYSPGFLMLFCVSAHWG